MEEYEQEMKSWAQNASNNELNACIDGIQACTPEAWQAALHEHNRRM